jgi:tetratricopeptide (TPR) repeat protein
LSRLDFAEQAESYFGRAGRLSLADQQLRAYGLVRGPHPERAIDAYREILRLAPGNVTAMRRLAATLLSQGDKVQLLELADRLDRVPGGEVIGAMLRGTVYHNDRNPQMAVASFERVLELDPGLKEMPASRPLLWDQLARDLIECGRVEDASRYLGQALAASPDAGLMNLLGYTYFLRGNLDEAERRYRQAAEMKPSWCEPHLALAKIAVQRRRREEALRQLDEARRLAPREYGVLYSLALLYRQLGRAADASKVQQEIKELQKAASSSPRGSNVAWPRYAL